MMNLSSKNSENKKTEKIEKNREWGNDLLEVDEKVFAADDPVLHVREHAFVDRLAAAELLAAAEAERAEPHFDHLRHGVRRAKVLLRNVPLFALLHRALQLLDFGRDAEYVFLDKEKFG